MSAKNKVLLIILDGWGLSPEEKGNAPFLAKTPILDYVYATYPKTSITASGLEVGISPGEPGNSEVGHLNLGSGRVVWEDLPRINQAIENEEFFTNEVFIQACEHAKNNNGKLHLWGLVSDGGVHSHIRHLIALLQLAVKQGVPEVFIHFVADGRDTAPKCAGNFVDQVEANIKNIGVGKIATIVGRYFAMDRDKNWDRVSKAYNLITSNEGARYATAKEAIEAQYAAEKTDEFLESCVIGDGGVISDNDAVIMFNYRSDRARQMVDVLTLGQETFEHDVPQNLFVGTMTQYRKGQSAPVAFPKLNLMQALAETISDMGMRQYHVAETEKYAHVTYFFNGGNETPNTGEDQVIVPSKKVATYDLAPEMSAREIVEKLQEALASDYEFVVVNFANGDMVGHTGILEAAIKACETVDTCLYEVLRLAANNGYRVIITADHGNCEVMIDEATGEPNKEHTTNPVPFIHLDFVRFPFEPQEGLFSKDDYIQYAVSTPVGVLADVAPSVLAILNIKQPNEMAGMDLSIAL